jgi:ribosomal protein S6--L-glutamate ligase
MNQTQLQSYENAILVVGGDQKAFDSEDYAVIHAISFAVELVYHQHKLCLVHNARLVKISSVIWRAELESIGQHERAVLEIIRRSGIPCINTAKCLLDNNDRVASKTTLREAGLPIVEDDIIKGKMAFLHYQPRFPCVLKIGDNHGGFGKARVNSNAEWEDVMDLAAVSRDYVCIEPFIKYIRDVRYLLVIGETFAIERVPSIWKANVNPTAVNNIAIDQELESLARRAANALGASVIGVDFIQDQEGRWWLLEANLIPGLDGYSENICAKLLSEITAISQD